MDAVAILTELAEKQASDIFLVAGKQITYKLRDKLYSYSDHCLSAADTAYFTETIYALANARNISPFNLHGDDDFSFSIANVARFRVNVYRQRGSCACVIRVVHFDIPEPAMFNIPETVMEKADVTGGLVIVTGVSGSGKSTTLACMVDRINTRRSAHIVTLEDPIEYLHPHKKSVVSQREISLDTDSYLTALKACLRQSPDVILIGEMRERETAEIAMTAAETGHTVITSMHTLGAANTIDRIIDLYPAEKQQQVRLQLSMVLSSVISQQLVETVAGELYPAFEVMAVNPAIRNLIREAKTYQIPAAIAGGKNEGMVSMDNYLIDMYKAGIISRDTLLVRAFDRNYVGKA